MAELIWDGKYDAHGHKRAPVRIELPFQTVETVNESAQERQRTLELSSSGHDPEWRNRLIWGDKKYVLPSLLPEFAGKVDLIYIDPPFDTGANFSFTSTIPESNERFTKEPSVLEHKAYRDTWGVSTDEKLRGISSVDKYLKWFSGAISLLYELLSDSGSIYVHLDWHIGHYVKVALDEAFGPESFRNEIVWKATNAHSDAKRYGSIHQTILFYTKSDDWTWNPQFEKYSDDYVKTYYRYKEPDGRLYASGDVAAAGPGPARKFKGKMLQPPPGSHWRFSQEKINEHVESGRIFFTDNGIPRFKRYLEEMPGMPVQSMWLDAEVPYVLSWSAEGVGYDTQKSEALLTRIIKASSNENDLVLDCFCGSGTTAAVAEKLNRRWIACDLGRFAIHTTRKRLLGIPGVKPFVVQNLGKYERQQWQVAEFPSNGKDRLEEQKEREAAYRKFILELYHATPVSGHAWLHGVKSGRMVHVAAVDAPVTRADVNAIAAEVWKAAGKGANSPQKPAVDILGWEFALELNETAKEVAPRPEWTPPSRKFPAKY